MANDKNADSGIDMPMVTVWAAILAGCLMFWTLTADWFMQFLDGVLK